MFRGYLKLQGFNMPEHQPLEEKIPFIIIICWFHVFRVQYRADPNSIGAPVYISIYIIFMFIYIIYMFMPPVFVTSGE